MAHPAKAGIITVICSSDPGRKEICDADTQFGVALIREFGNADCQIDRNWGFDEKGVWVAEGCRGQFALGGFRLPEAAVPATATRLVCESGGGDRTQCAVYGLRGVGLVRQISSSTCVFNRNWGYGADGIWVAGGCGAEFAVLR